jgi:hypothetical protein
VPSLARGRRPGSPHEFLDLLQREDAILVSVHRLKDPLVSRLKLLQRDGPSPSLSIITNSIRIIMPECREVCSPNP